MRQYNDLHTHLRLPPLSLSLAHQIVFVIQRLPAISAYGPNEIQCQMGEGASPIGFHPSHHLNDVLLGTT